MENESNNRNTEIPEGSLLLRYIQDKLSEEERREVDAWREADPSHEEILLQTARIVYANRTIERINRRAPEKAYRRVEARLKKRLHLNWLRHAGVAAACILGGFLLATAFYYRSSAERPQAPQQITLQARAGMQTRFDLPDGTIAYLNSGSSLSYPLPYDKKERRVTLEGEAYFKVASDSEWPFVVSVADDRYRVQVVGTEFNVQAYETKEAIVTTLVSGSVNLSIRGKNGKTYRQELYPSERAVYDATKEHLEIEKVNTIYETAWIEGKLMFKNTPLPEVLRELTNYYNVEFDIRVPDLANYRLTGIFQNRQLSQILDYLKITSRIEYRIVDPEIDTPAAVRRTRVILHKR